MLLRLLDSSSLNFRWQLPSDHTHILLFFTVGLGAAVFDGIAMSYFQNGAIKIWDFAVIVMGDMTGMLICLIATMYFFRLARVIGRTITE